MLLRRKEGDELLRAQLEELLSTLRERHKFLSDLKDESDWAFVIKVQALVEGVIGSAVLILLGEERIKETVEQLPLVGEKTSKLALAKSLNLLNPAQRRFVKRMASLRNDLAHRPETVNFSFEAYVASLDKAARRDWQESVVWFADKPETKDVWCRFAVELPRETIYLGAFLLVALLDLDGAHKDGLRKIDAVAEQTTKELLADLGIGKSA